MKLKIEWDVVDKFNNDKDTKLLIGNIKAAGEGIDLSAADAVVFAEFGWTPGEHDQAEERVFRASNPDRKIAAYYLIVQDTIEEEIVELIDRKRRIVNAVSDGRETEDFELITELLKRYKEGR